MRIALVISLFIPVLALGQYRIQPVAASLMFVSGAAKGYNDVLQYHYPKFAKVHHNANEKWCNPALSWRNKYKNGNPDEGPRFFLSTTLLVPVTDMQHLVNSLHKYSAIGTVVFHLGDKGRPWQYYVYDFIVSAACYSAGFWLVYEGVYR